MQCGFDKELLTKLLFGELSDAERAPVEAHLAECAECREELAVSRRMWGMLEEVETPEPLERAQVRFDAMLDSYKAAVGVDDERVGLWSRLRQLFAGHPGFSVSYSLLLIVAGLGFGYLLHRPSSLSSASAVSPPVSSPSSGVTGGVSSPGGDSKELAALTAQVKEMREMMMKTLLQNPSASERMRGVSYTSELSTVNKPVIEALLTTLNNDANTNVRLMTLEALTHYTDNPYVREGLVQSILQQDSPLVQAALADVMLRLQEKKAIRPFKKLLQQKDLNKMVRNRIEQTISRLS